MGMLTQNLLEEDCKVDYSWQLLICLTECLLLFGLITCLLLILYTCKDIQSGILKLISVL